MKRGRKLNTFTVEEALSLFARAGNDDQRREILERLTLAKLRELAKEQGIALECNIKKEFVINLIINFFENLNFTSTLKIIYSTY